MQQKHRLLAKLNASPFVVQNRAFDSINSSSPIPMHHVALAVPQITKANDDIDECVNVFNVHPH